MNIVVISGNITRQPEHSMTKNGSGVLKFGMAVNERWKNNQTGEWEERPNFFDVIVFGRRTEWLSNNLRKGMKVIVEGRLQYSSWDDKQTGKKRSKVEVIANDVELPPRGQSQPQHPHGGYNQQPNNYTDQGQYGPQNGPQQPAGAYQGQYQQGYQQQNDMYAEDIPF